ncbi:hypothetical protein KKC32_01340 [Patescibacteria group bacterium]|nr:hypothetical protein [Patescibacteria group bacterium]
MDLLIFCDVCERMIIGEPSYSYGGKPMHPDCYREKVGMNFRLFLPKKVKSSLIGNRVHSVRAVPRLLRQSHK